MGCCAGKLQFHKETKRQHWAKVKVTGGDPAEMLTGELVELLGPVGVFETELYAFQLHFGILPCRYPKMETWKLLAPLDPDTVDPARGRQDCTHLHVLSIDNASTRDIDDALSYKRLENGNMQFGVHIADVTAFVRHGSALDLEARQRATTVDLVDRRMDMLPSLLSEVLCSLRSGTSVCSAPCASALVFTNPSRC